MSAAPGPNAPAGFVLGRYHVGERLGEGGMGTVYRGHDPVLDRDVAIKTISLAMAKEDVPDYEARFFQEARAAGGLAHPNIVAIYDIGKTEQHAYMVMEYVRGPELRQLLTRHGKLPVQDAADVCAQVADGLAYAHARGVVHRDIKPTNIMISEDGGVKVTDFGIARMRSSELKTMTGLVLGSPRYMSPEQVTGGAIDARSDVFSLGVVLYELLTGRSPFLADSVQGAMYHALNTMPVPPSGVRTGLPRVFDFITAKAIAKDPANRYGDIAKMASDLRAAAGLAERFRKLTLLSGGSESVTTPDGAIGPAPPAGNAAGLAEPKTMSLSGAFDSTAATRRLLAIGNGAPGTELAATPLEPIAPTRSSDPPRGPQRWTPWLWGLSAASIAAAAVLLLR